MLRSSPDERASRQRIQRCRLGEQESLPGNTSQLEQRGHLRLELNTLGDSVQPQRVTQTDHRPGQLRPILRIGEPTDKGPVDFQDVDRETMQVGKRGVAGTEVIYGQPHAQSLQLLEILQDGIRVVHDRTFSQLNYEIRRLEARLLQRTRDILQQLAMLQMAAGNID